MTNYQKLIAGNLLEAHTWKGLLESENIDVRLKGESLTGAAGELPAYEQVELWVNANQKEQALTILNELNLSRPSWICPNCNEENASSFEICWQCNQ